MYYLLKLAYNHYFSRLDLSANVVNPIFYL